MTDNRKTIIEVDEITKNIVIEIKRPVIILIKYIFTPEETHQKSTLYLVNSSFSVKLPEFAFREIQNLNRLKVQR